MVSNQEEITGELCGIIEQFVLADINEEESSFYPRKSHVKISPNQPAVTRFAKLLKTKGLNLNVSTSKENSLLAHTVMFARLVLEDVNDKRSKQNFTRRKFYAPALRRTRHLIDLMAQHPSVIIHGKVRFEPGRFVLSDFIIYEIADSLCSRYNLGAWQSVFDRVIVDANLPLNVVWRIMSTVDDDTATTIVNNVKFDPMAMSSFGATVLGTMIAYEHCEAVEDMLMMKKCLPNQMTRVSIMRSEHAPPTPSPGPPAQTTKRLVHALLGHKDTDITHVRPQTNGKWMINANSMMQLLDHHTFDIHNLVILSDEELAIQAAPHEVEDMDFSDDSESDDDEDNTDYDMMDPYMMMDITSESDSDDSESDY